jgi:nucleoside 2-deoxyribosyltransferase
MTTSEPPRIYLAGPEVFLPNAKQIGAAKAKMCAEHDLVGVFPLDGELDLDGLAPDEQARRISLANEGLMHSCAAIIANMTPFRGAAMDSGTAYEVGFMRALGKPVFGYSNVASDYADRARAIRQIGLPVGDFDADDVEIEDFGLTENLMIAVAVSETGAAVIRHASDVAHVRVDLAGFQRAVESAAGYFKEIRAS